MHAVLCLLLTSIVPLSAPCFVTYLVFSSMNSCLEKENNVDTKLGPGLFPCAFNQSFVDLLIQCCENQCVYLCPAPDTVGESWIPSCEPTFLLPASFVHWNAEEGKLESDFSRILAECWHRFPLSQCSRKQITALRIGKAVIPSFVLTMVWSLPVCLSSFHV